MGKNKAEPLLTLPCKIAKFHYATGGKNNTKD